MCQWFGLKGAEAGADGTTGPRGVVRQTLLASEPAPNALASAALQLLSSKVDGEDGGGLRGSAGAVMVVMMRPLLLLPSEEILVAQRNTTVIPV